MLFCTLRRPRLVAVVAVVVDAVVVVMVNEEEPHSKQVRVNVLTTTPCVWGFHFTINNYYHARLLPPLGSTSLRTPDPVQLRKRRMR